ncbi:lysophospholipid acyltransferase family protein [Desulfosarcina variabilis]|uniref:lysophospholipid acyltransferase family protein n=1 Tax=Desulfosarcina variabilis TaxID=2300 RepID=UPI003AFA3BA2
MNSAPHLKWLQFFKDVVITVTLWAFETIGFVILFAPFYCLAWIFSRDVARSFQRLNSGFYRWFFALVRALVPACRWQIDDAVKAIRGSVVVANHISYLDPILLFSLFPRHTTIAKRRLFHIPIFGWMLRLSGYLPSSSDRLLADLVLLRIEQLPTLLDDGGNLVVFPEGTRSRDGRIGSFNTGPFKIARLCNAPIDVLYLEGTARLFKPGRFLFDTGSPNTIYARHLARLEPCYDDPDFSLRALMAKVKNILEMRQSNQ